MKIKHIITGMILIVAVNISVAQNNIPLDTTTWTIRGKHLFEKNLGDDAIYLQGSMTLNDIEFLNGTIEFDVHLKRFQSFPGISFRTQERDSEKFLLRPHLSGKEDANQAAPTTNNITSFQLYFGPKYSFPYTYKFDDWTHVKLVINDNRAQVYLDHSETPHHSWYLYHEPKTGGIRIQAGGREGAQHIANVKIDPNAIEIVDFKPIKEKTVEDLIPEWEISDMFEEKSVNDLSLLKSALASRTWIGTIQIEEGIAANIARKVHLYDGTPGNTVLARVIIHSDSDQLKLFEFGYSDRVVAILNGIPIYKGTNKYRSRDYRYLGTIGLFDAIYLPLKKGENELLMAVSEDFGGWLITGRFKNKKGIKIIK
ncbi:hypothetical protein [uncultured Psychroserpens sp.]|uniref:hypothetical protein n=1 Tax=uncultured Psychroserpens sp. TaxID=255436 RepID=UPI002613E867|nr:hypothetical protein [uncultured Psychroserpens sp.]